MCSPFIWLAMVLERLSRDLSATEIISMSFNLYLSKFMYFFLPFFFSNLVNNAVRYALEVLIFPQSLPEIGTDIQSFIIDSLPYLLAFFVFSMLTWWVISTIVNGVAVEYVNSILEGENLDVERTILFLVYNIRTLSAAGLITGVLTVLGLLCFVVPGFMIAVAFALVVPVMVIERRGALESLGRSRRLVGKGWVKALTIVAVTSLLIIVAGVLGEALSLATYHLREILLTVLIALVQPVQPIALTYLYYSMRVKEESAITPTVPAAPKPEPEVPAEAYPRFCYLCGQELPLDAIFCPRCGRQVRKPPRPRLA